MNELDRLTLLHAHACAKIGQFLGDRQKFDAETQACIKAFVNAPEVYRHIARMFTVSTHPMFKP